MSLTVNSSPLNQQQALQSQIAATNGATAATNSDSGTGATAAAAKPADTAAAVVSGAATLTSDMLAVLLNDQASGGSSVKAAPAMSLAGILDQQDQATLAQSGLATSSLLDGIPSLLDQMDSVSRA